MEIFEIKVPGIGVRYDFTTEAGDRAGIVIRRDGTRDIVIYDREDADAALGTIELSEGDAAAIAELLGGTTITVRL